MKKQHTIFDLETGDIITSEPIPDDVDPTEFFRQQIHDCPECRAARERGEEAIIIGPEELAELALATDEDEEIDEIETRQTRRHRERLARKR